ncbi:helix-turn-helix transcriptional regulator [Rossellomorea marisflavi]|uniref:helix-turn-helix transcriptional regulator n=1 Tax=Rossellomorea marisflavi TaxID=189381 RepID=UPI003D2EA54A
MSIKRSYLKEKRKKMGLTQEQVAKKLGISITFYNQIENGTRNPKLKLALEIAEFFLLDVKMLVP